MENTKLAAQEREAAICHYCQDTLYRQAAATVVDLIDEVHVQEDKNSMYAQGLRAIEKMLLDRRVKDMVAAQATVNPAAPDDLKKAFAFALDCWNNNVNA